MTEIATTPVTDTVPKVDDVAVGEDLAFQRRWWVFERIVWSVFVVIIACDIVGLLGHGWLSKATRATPDGALTLDYERIERMSSPSTMALHFGPAAIRSGKVQVHASTSVVKSLGAQRISPQPETSAIGDGGFTYTFPATHAPADVEIQLEPNQPGLHRFSLNVPGEPPVAARILVLP